MQPRQVPLLAACLLAAHPSLADIDETVVEAERIDGVGSLELEEITHVGSRLGLTILETPASVELISAGKITLRGDYGANAAVTRSTGFSNAANPGNGSSAVAVRGFLGHGSVVNLFDGTRLYVGAGTVTFPADTWNIDSIEILRGPGSVVHGVGATGATVNYVPRMPRPGETDLAIQAALGSDDFRRLAAGGNVPIGNRFAVRLDASVTENGDYAYIDRADSERQVLSAAVLFQATPDFDITLRVDYANVADAPYWGTPLVNDEILDATRGQNYNVADGLVEYEDWWPRLRIDWALGSNARLRSETYYLSAERHWRNLESYAYNAGTGLIDRDFYLEILHDQDQVGNRSDLTIDHQLFGLANRVSVGFEVNQIEFAHTNNSPYSGSSSVPLTDFDPGLFLQIDPTTPDYDTDVMQYAVFVDDVIDLSDRFRFVVGLRFDSVDYERNDVVRSNGQSADYFETTLEDWSGRIGLVYQPSERVSLYAQGSRAIDGVDSILSLRSSRKDFDLAKSHQFEIGAKATLPDDRGSITLAYYDITKEDLLSTNPENPSETQQIGEQSSQGIELATGFRLLDTVSIDADFSILDAQYDEFRSGSDNYAGNVPRGVPEKTGNLWVSWWAHPAWRLSAGVRYVGDRYANDANTVTLPDYAIVDASLRWAVTESAALTLRGRNLFDEEDYVITSYGSRQWLLGPPAAAELTFDYSFGGD